MANATVTVKDVAREAEVSIGTVSNVFNNHPSVTDETRRRVLKVAASLGYIGANGQPNGTKRILKEIGFLVCDANLGDRPATINPFWSHILAGVEGEARKYNFKITYRSLDIVKQSPQQTLESVQEMRLSGILLIGTPSEELINLLLDTRLPMVLVDNHIPKLPVDAVLGDNYEGAKAAVEYLIEQGHRQIAFIGGPVAAGPRPVNQIYTIERRASGYRTALLDAGLTIDYDLYESGKLELESGYAACKRLLNKKAHFTALFCANDATAIGALRALREAGRRVPQDVSLVGFDDIDMAEHISPALTTVRVYKEAMGATALRSLIYRASDPEAVSVTATLRVDLIKRESVVSC